VSTVANIASSRIWWLNGDPTRIWPDDVQLTVSVNLKAKSVRRESQYVCRPQEASWQCTTVNGSDTDSSCADGTIYHARGPGDDIMLINPRDGLPIDAACQAKAEGGNPNTDDLQRRYTRSDDKTVRLTPMRIQTCR
jgi:hypothetical protein